MAFKIGNTNIVEYKKYDVGKGVRNNECQQHISAPKLLGLVVTNSCYYASVKHVCDEGFYINDYQDGAYSCGDVNQSGEGSQSVPGGSLPASGTRSCNCLWKDCWCEIPLRFTNNCRNIWEHHDAAYSGCTGCWLLEQQDGLVGYRQLHSYPMCCIYKLTVYCASNDYRIWCSFEGCCVDITLSCTDNGTGCWWACEGQTDRTLNFASSGVNSNPRASHWFFVYRKVCDILPYDHDTNWAFCCSWKDSCCNTQMWYKPLIPYGEDVLCRSLVGCTECRYPVPAGNYDSVCCLKSNYNLVPANTTKQMATDYHGGCTTNSRYDNFIWNKPVLGSSCGNSASGDGYPTYDPGWHDSSFCNCRKVWERNAPLCYHRCGADDVYVLTFF